MADNRSQRDARIDDSQLCEIVVNTNSKDKICGFEDNFCDVSVNEDVEIANDNVNEPIDNILSNSKGDEMELHTEDGSVSITTRKEGECKENEEEQLDGRRRRKKKKTRKHRHNQSHRHHRQANESSNGDESSRVNAVNSFTNMTCVEDFTPEYNNTQLQLQASSFSPQRSQHTSQGECYRGNRIINITLDSTSHGREQVRESSTVEPPPNLNQPYRFNAENYITTRQRQHMPVPYSTTYTEFRSPDGILVSLPPEIVQQHMVHRPPTERFEVPLSLRDTTTTFEEELPPPYSETLERQRPEYTVEVSDDDEEKYLTSERLKQETITNYTGLCILTAVFFPFLVIFLVPMFKNTIKLRQSIRNDDIVLETKLIKKIRRQSMVALTIGIVTYVIGVTVAIAIILKSRSSM